MHKSYSIIQAPTFSDSRGSLSVIEGVSEYCPFEIKRIYWLFGATSKIKRGMHGHKKLKQVFMLLKGKCTLVIENASERTTLELLKSGDGVFIDSGFWREVNLSEDSILLVLADSVYDKSDYITDYDEFKIWSKSSNA
jgi:dTDP-4-dehydrorhamnose 3,5-epimerase-like enzyme